MLGWGHGEEGAWAALLLLARGGPIFFQMGKLRHKEVWELAQVTHSESAFGEGAAHTLGNKVTQASVTSPLGSKNRQGLRAQGCLEGNTQPFQGGLGG